MTCGRRFPADPNQVLETIQSDMSIHPSLRGADSLTGQRSVYTRVERLTKLFKEGKLGEDDSAYGLPKVRTQYKVAKKKKKAEDDEDKPEEAAEAASED